MSSSMPRNHEEEVKKRLKAYYQYFKAYFEQLVKEYCKQLEDRVERPGMDSVQENATAVAQAVIKPNTIIEKAAPAIVKTAVEIFKVGKEKERLKELIPVILEAKINDTGVKRKLADFCFEIWKSYEMIFANISLKGDYISAMKILAEEAVVAIINHKVLHKSPEEELTVQFMLEAIQHLDPEKSTNVFMRVLMKVCTDIKASITQDTNLLNILGGKEVEAAKVYAKVGFIDHHGTFYRRMDGKCKAAKYGYRCLFGFEKLDDTIYIAEDNQFPQLKNYEFVLRHCNKEAVIMEMLDVVEKSNNEVITEVCDKVKNQIDELKQGTERYGKKETLVHKTKIGEWENKLKQKAGKTDASFTVKESEIQKWNLDLEQE